MRAPCGIPWFSAFLALIGLVVFLAWPGQAAAASIRGPAAPAHIQPASIAPSPATQGNTPGSQPATSSQTDSWLDGAMQQPADAFSDPAFWAVMGLVVLGHFVLESGFHQSR